MSFLPVYIYFIVTCFLISLTVFRNSKEEYRYLKSFPFFLFGSVIIECLGSYLGSLGRNNITIYNVFILIEFCYYLFIISLIIRKKRIKQLLRLVIVIYALIFILNYVFFQGVNQFHTNTYALGCLLVVASCMYYFFELFQLPKSDNLVRNPAFWICTALLFYYCCSFPLFAFINVWVDISPILLDNFENIITILNIFLYTLLAIAFLCIRTRKYTL